MCLRSCQRCELSKNLTTAVWTEYLPIWFWRLVRRRVPLLRRPRWRAPCPPGRAPPPPADPSTPRPYNNHKAPSVNPTQPWTRIHMTKSCYSCSSNDLHKSTKALHRPTLFHVYVPWHTQYQNMLNVAYQIQHHTCETYPRIPSTTAC